MHFFLDIDGVMTDHTSNKLMPDQVACLNQLVERCMWGGHTVKIIFNTAWNIHTLEYMVDAFTAAGFKYPEMLVGQTDSTGGGGDPVRRWLTEQGVTGEPYLIIDDSVSCYREMRCRLIHCMPTEGLTMSVVERASASGYLDHKLDEQCERDRATAALFGEAQRLAYRTPWLTPVQRAGYIRETLDLLAHCLVVPNFLEAAYLKKKDPDGTPTL